MAKVTFRDPKHLRKSIELLKVVVETLDKHKIKYYLDFGTLIGAMRDHALIPWDYDIDISLVNEEEYSKLPLVLQEIKKKYGHRTYLHTFQSSFEKHKKKHPNAIIPHIDFATLESYQIAKVRDNNFWIFGRGGVCIDIFCKYHKANTMYWVAFGEVNKVSDEPLKEGFEQIDFYGISCTVPKAYDVYLTSIYGNWKQPNEHWTQEDKVNR